MNSHTIIQELLLFKDTSFAKRELCEWDDDSRPQPPRSIADQLEDACWSGLLFEMFPEMFSWNNRKKMCVWKVSQAEQFIHVEVGDSHTAAAYETSIDPYYFLTLEIYNN